MARVFAHEAFKECLKQNIDSRYEMILLAAHRARNLNKLSKDKLVLPAEEYYQRGTSNAVTVLREMESGNLDLNELKEQYINTFKKVTEITDQEIESDQQ